MAKISRGARKISDLDEALDFNNIPVDDGTPIGKRMTKASLKTLLTIEGTEMEPLVGGDTEPTALVVPNGPAGDQRTAEVASGKWYDFGSGPVQASADRRWKSYWSGTAWSLKDMGSLPDNSAKAKPWSAGSYEANSIVSHNEIEWISKLDTSQEPSETATDWKVLGSAVNKLNPTISADFIHKIITAGDLVELPTSVYKDGFYLDRFLTERTNSGAEILSSVLTEGTYILQIRTHKDFWGKAEDSSGNVVLLFNTKSYDVDYQVVYVPLGQTYTLYLSQFKGEGTQRGEAYNYRTRVYRYKESFDNNMVLKSLGEVILSSLERKDVPIEKVYEQYYNNTPTIVPSIFCVRTAKTVPSGMYNVRTMLAMDAGICMHLLDGDGNILVTWRGDPLNPYKITDVVIDTEEYTKTTNVTFLVSGIRYGDNDINTAFPEEITIQKVERKITASKDNDRFTGDINVTPIHGQSLSLAIVHGTPAIHGYIDSYGLMFNDHVYQVGATEESLTEINPLYEKTQESSAYGTATMIRRLLSGNNQSDLLDRCIYMTAGKDGGFLNAMIKPSVYYSSLTAAMVRAKELNPNKDVRFPAVYLIQGEAESGNNYDAVTYKNEIKKFRNDLQIDAYEILGQTTPVKLIVYQIASQQHLENTIKIQMAHLNAVLEDENIAMSTPMYILDYVADRLHIGNRAEYILGGHQGIAYKKAVVDRQRALPLYCKSVEKIASNKLLLRFNVPHGPLVFDNTLVSQISNNGFKVLVGGVDVCQSSELYMDDGVILTCSQDISSGEVCYGYFPEIVGETGRLAGARGNLRDSQGDIYTLPMPDGSSYRLDNYSVVFKIGF